MEVIPTSILSFQKRRRGALFQLVIIVVIVIRDVTAVAELDLIEQSPSFHTADRFINEVLSETHYIARRANGTKPFFQLSSIIQWASTDVTR